MLFQINYLLTIAALIIIPISLYLSHITTSKHYKIWSKEFLAVGFSFSLILSVPIALFYSSFSHIVIEVSSDTSNNLRHKKSSLFGNRTFIIGENKVIDTAELADYTSLIINYTNRDLVISNIIYLKEGNSKNYREEGDLTISGNSYYGFHNNIRYFFDYKKPDEKIREKNYSDFKKEYWLKEK